MPKMFYDNNNLEYATRVQLNAKDLYVYSADNAKDRIKNMWIKICDKGIY